MSGGSVRGTFAEASQRARSDGMPALRRKRLFLDGLLGTAEGRSPIDRTRRSRQVWNMTPGDAHEPSACCQA